MAAPITSKERIILALSHKEADRIPFDLGSTSATGIHVAAYRRLLDHLGSDRPIQVADMMQQMAYVDDEVLDYLKVDTRGISPNLPSSREDEIVEDGDYRYFSDRWGIKYRMPRDGGLYYDMAGHPLQGDIGKPDIDGFKFPAATEIPEDTVLQVQDWESGRNPPAIVLEATEGGFLEISTWLRGFEGFYTDIAGDPGLACYLMDRIIEFKMESWEKALKKIGKHVTVAWEADDLGTQNRTMFSPDFYRKYVKPRHKKLFRFIRDVSPKEIFIAFHSCGSIYELIPDLIEVGVDAINPVQVSAAKMDTKKLKAEFGEHLSFWGGGVDTQKILPRGTPQEVKEEVRRRIEDLAPGGGFVFNPVHNVQADVSAENFAAMWEAFREYAAY
jgi:uroporphyrinogen decarboxylase